MSVTSGPGKITINGRESADVGAPEIIVPEIRFAVPLLSEQSALELSRYAQNFGKAVLSCQAVIAPAFQAMLDNMQAAQAAFEAAQEKQYSSMKGKSFDADGTWLFVADDDGCVALGGYREDLDWLHGLLRFRYGAGLVSRISGPDMSVPPSSPDSLRFFVFFERAAIHRNPRWRMYCNLP